MPLTEDDARASAKTAAKIGSNWVVRQDASRQPRKKPPVGKCCYPYFQMIFLEIQFDQVLQARGAEQFADGFIEQTTTGKIQAREIVKLFLCKQTYSTGIHRQTGKGEMSQLRQLEFRKELVDMSGKGSITRSAVAQ